MAGLAGPRGCEGLDEIDCQRFSIYCKPLAFFSRRYDLKFLIFFYAINKAECDKHLNYSAFDGSLNQSKPGPGLGCLRRMPAELHVFCRNAKDLYTLNVVLCYYRFSRGDMS